MKFLKYCLYEVDLFKIPFAILFKNRSKSSTYLGSFFSIALLVFLAYMLMTSDMIQKTNPNVIDQVITNNHSPLISLTPQNFQAAAGLADSLGGGFVDPTIFKIQFAQIIIDTNPSTQTKRIASVVYFATHPCTPEDFVDPMTYDNLGLNNFNCLNNGTFTLEGGFDEKSVQAMVVLISYCNNQTDDVICKPQSEINNYFNGKGLWFYYQDIIYDLSNYETPLQTNFKLEAIQTAAVPRPIDIYIKQLNFVNDDNFLFTSTNSLGGFMKDRVEYLSSYVVLESPLISMTLYSSKNVQNSKRTYQKIGSLLASIGGLINILIIFGFFITNLQNQLIMQSHIMNKLYIFQQESNRNYKPEDWEKNLDEKNNDTPEINIPKDQSNLKAESKENAKKDQKTCLDLKEVSNILANESDHEQATKHLNLKNADKISNKLKEENVNLNEGISKQITFNQPSPGLLKSQPLQPKGFNKIAILSQKEEKNDDNSYQLHIDKNFPIQLNFLEYIFMQVKKFFFKRLSEKEQLFHKSEKKFYKETDIVYILRKIQEIEKLKLILLNEEQLQVFHLLTKPLIFLENQNTQKMKKTAVKMANLMSFTSDKLETIKHSIFLQYYNKYSQETNLSDIDKRLLKIIKEDIN